MRDRRTIWYDKPSKQWKMIDFDGTESSFLTITDLRDWLDFMENQRG